MVEQAEARTLTPKEVKDLEREAERLEDTISSQSANGLFSLTKVKDAKITSEDCYDLVDEARRKLTSKTVTYENYVSAKSALNRGWEKIDEAIETAGTRYKLRAIYALDVLSLLLVSSLLIMFLGSRYPLVKILSLLPFAVLATGAIGALLRHFWTVAFNLSNRQYMRNWITQIFFVPFIGSLLGAGIYAIYFVLRQVTQQPVEVFDMFSLLLAFIGGFGWEESYTLLVRFSKRTLGSLLRRAEEKIVQSGETKS